MKLKLLFIIIVFSFFNTTNAQNGDPSVFGDNVWNVYAYNSTDTSFPLSNYAGFYTESSLSFDTQSRWDLNGSPSDASGYAGNVVGNDYHSYAAKRQGFTPGYYLIDIPGHDDEAYLLINGVEVWNHIGCCDSHTDVWEGVLDANSTIEYRITESGGGSYGAIKIAMVTIDAVVAPFSSSSCLTTVTVTATGGQSPYTGTGEFIVGPGTHDYTVTDSYGATSSTSVLVKDDSKPTISTQDITVNLGADGQVVVTPEMIDNNSSDNCGIVNRSLDKTTFSCADIGAISVAQPVAFTNVPDVSQNIHSWGGGYNPNTNEFWYPEWSGSTIYKYDSSHNLIGSFTAPVSQIMQLWMDKSSSDYYTANFYNYTITRINGDTVVWSYNLGFYASAVTTNDLYVFAMTYSTDTIVVLDKTTGAFVKNITLPGYFEIYGGLVYANGIIYISGHDNDGISTVPTTMNAIHSFDANTGAYINSVATPQSAYNTAFDGETIWTSDSNSGSGTINGCKISNGNVYENGAFGNRVKLTVTDAAGNSASRTARVIVKDVLVPVITSNGDINTDAELGVCGATVVVSATVADNCTVGTPDGVRNDGKLLTDLYPTGTTTIAWNVTDANGNTAVEVTQTVTVTDNEVPVITADGDKNVNLDLGVCGATVVVSASAADNCSVGAPTGVRSDAKLLSDLYPTGTTTIAWNVTDANGNAAVEVIQTVIVSDNEKPVITSNGDKNVNVDSGVCGATVVVSASAADNCTVGTPTGVRSDGKLLSDLYPTGTTTIAWNVNDANGNAAVEATQTVTVIDNILPTALTQDITVQLGTIGTASITLAQIDNGSSDSCGIATLALDKTSFSCANVGNNTVTLTVTDSSGNASTATAIVTVQDVTPPTVLTKNITVQLGVTGAVSIIASQIDNGSSDNCGIASIMVSPDSFTCDNVGDNTVTLTVTDNSGNVTTSSAIVKVNNSFTANTITRNLDTLSADETSATTYQWMTCNGGIYANLTGETNQSYTAMVVGSYSVEVTKNGCTQRSTCFDITTLGNKDFDFNSKLSVYPNPFNDVISISLDSSAKMEIYDILGQTIYSKKINSGTTSLNLSNNANGMYLMKIITENNQSKTLKILKE
ncbi:hypothetical protein DOS84_15995 [Flavobacterium aquariorum]|uniref:Secretion system C-terminal sorting domain-containing protein n=1 Tax=Flavobacterium aquariorum TaxID=2217670 RepID=A0A2W7VJ28_9FLAO|nr:T9SS type A sorting domain-containing protein [Flavobacterium aquariorum]PZX92312.1 hypothetical protein DOS84_15995 [Flavobacterium aquariorum]